jgi:predicted unusual protein kinase regulating ubiquinone biosynthesis (AarF/ABC1/UbiB family)
MISLKYLPRYKDLAWLLIKYGRSDLVKQLGIDVPLSKAPATTAAAEELANDLKAMGPTYIKLGQLLSTQLDFLPESFQNVLSQLQDHVEPFLFEEVEKIILSELGVRI